MHLGDTENRTLKRDAVAIVNAKITVIHRGDQMRRSNYDVIVFMIAVTGG